MDAHEWRYSREDPAALEEIRRRVEECGRQRGLISYSDLVSGIEFQLPSIWPDPHSIDVHDWSGLERKVIGDFLGCITAHSYREHDFMASALVVGKYADQPSEHFLPKAVEAAFLSVAPGSASGEGAEFRVRADRGVRSATCFHDS